MFSPSLPVVEEAISSAPAADAAPMAPVEWTPYALEPSEVVTIVNVLASGCKRGAFNIEEYELLTPLHRRLLVHLVKYHGVATTEEAVPEAETPLISTNTTTTVSAKRSKKRKRS
jgi:hypothetical protein